MAKKSGVRAIFGLACIVCGTRGYVTSRNKLNTPEKMKPKKFCSNCRKVQEHKEIEKLK
ncbi:MAG: 50S ribosomal protein L33 [Candidatus Levybacteria bacterium RIFCSPHIGHO2_01_FULL_40_10]|nr:MAG: 50S ribosomal protein L33 [Candidatus Levybacteria bacterium RIFCSPHIGHO2_01_FULL_40_10]